MERERTEIQAHIRFCRNSVDDLWNRGDGFIQGHPGSLSSKKKIDLLQMKKMKWLELAGDSNCVEVVFG